MLLLLVRIKVGALIWPISLLAILRILVSATGCVRGLRVWRVACGLPPIATAEGHPPYQAPGKIAGHGRLCQRLQTLIIFETSFT